jgi:histidine triad (HIT) family protein
VRVNSLKEFPLSLTLSPTGREELLINLEVVIVADCLFCKIIKKEIPSKIDYEDDKVLAFEDINPQAPVHVLIVPKKHIASLNELEKKDRELLGDIFLAARKIAEDRGVAEAGYRAGFYVGPDAGMAVAHLHLHVLGGRKLGWPPG